jgi:phosphoglycolate phosphatase
MGYDLYLFDLDGTLTDPKIGITKSVRYALAGFGISVPSLDHLTKFIGPPLRDSFKIYYGFSDAEAEKAVSIYREYFSEYGIYENTVYPGVPEALDDLNEHSKTIILATSKPTVYAERILAHFGLNEYFTLVAGSELNGSRSLKSEVIKYALDIVDPQRTKSAVMIGDREHDIIGARKNGIDSVGVTYGYGSRQELEDAGATMIINAIGGILSYL